MLKMRLAAGLAATALLAGSAMAQTSGPTQPVGSGQILTQMPPDLMRGSSFIGLGVYGADNQKIGNVDEILVDRQGKVLGFVVGVGGLLGIGQKDVVMRFDQVQWMSYQEVRASLEADQSGYGTNTAGSATAPNPATGGTIQQAAPSSMGDTGGATSTGSYGSTPARALVQMTRADLENAPEFRYSPND
jgi:sporulation protein YlmC with PRC-barrel domain